MVKGVECVATKEDATNSRFGFNLAGKNYIRWVILIQSAQLITNTLLIYYLLKVITNR